jgi:transposase
MFYHQVFKNIILAEGLKVKNFKRSVKNNGAKTDKEDCILLAEYGKQFHSQLKLYEPRNETREVVKTLYYRLQSLKDYRQREKNRLKRPDNTIAIIKSINEHIEFLNNQIDNLKKEIMKLIGIDEDGDSKKDGGSGNNGSDSNNNSRENDEGRNINIINNKDSKELKLIYNTLLKEKGVGQETALTLICSMQELGKTERKQIASISGLAPTPKESGTITGHRYLQGRRRDIKSAMYLCIMNMIRYDKNIKDKINEFVSKGKNKKTAICVLARKKITILNAIVKKQLALNGFA